MSWLKRIVRHVLAALVYYSGLFHLVLAIRRRRNPMLSCPILMYHRVIDPADATNRYTQPGIAVTRETFKQQISYLHDKYRIISLDTLVGSLAGGAAPEPRNVVITFDDGWQDNYEHALPVLKEAGAAATVYLCSDYVGTPSAFWFLKVGIYWAEAQAPGDQSAEILSEAGLGGMAPESLDMLLQRLKGLDSEALDSLADQLLASAAIGADRVQQRRWILNWDEVREMNAAGVEFGSHGRGHRILTQLGDRAVADELRESKTAIEITLGRDVNHFAYPNGDYDRRVQDMARESGYLSAVAISPELTSDTPDLFALPRVNVHEGMSLGWSGCFSRAVFACAIHRVFPFG